MKKIILLLFILLFITGCTPVLQAETIPVVPETVTVTSIVTETITVEDTAKIEELQNEVDDYKSLISQLNELLKNVYYIECVNSIGGIGGATAFSIKYNNKIYIISAGHLVDNENGKFSNFKANRISIKLLAYDNDYLNRNDYAIFVSNKIDNGFNVDLDNDKPLFIINDTISDYTKRTIEGESGSPVIDLDGEVTEIATTDMYRYNTDIDIVLQAINTMQ